MSRIAAKAKARLSLGSRPAGVFIDGVAYLRYRYGTEPWVVDDAEAGWPEACPDCGARWGEYHFLACGIEVCPRCGKQLGSCGCLSASTS